MILRVDFPDGPCLADAGFGGHLMTTPLRLERDTVQETPCGTFRIIGDDRLLLQTLFPSGWADIYRFTLDPVPPIDYVVGNWYTSAHPKSMFTNNLLVQIVTDAGRTTLSNSKFTERTFAGESEERTLESAAELERVLGDAFGIELPVPAREIWDRLPAG